MPTTDRPLMIVSGILTLIFGGVYLTLWMIGTTILGELPWLGDLGFFVLEIFLGVAFLVGLIMVLVSVIIPNYPVMIWIGGLFSIIFGALFAFFSPGAHLIFYSTFWYSWVFMVITGITAILFLVAGRHTYGMTPRRVEKILNRIKS